MLFLETYGIMCPDMSQERIRMKTETENAIRSIASLDPGISPTVIDRVIDIMKGISEESENLIHVVRYNDALELLKVSRRTLSYYVDHGYLDRVYGCGCRAIGVSRESLLRFLNRRVVRRVVPYNNNLKRGRPPKKSVLVAEGTAGISQ